MDALPTAEADRREHVAGQLAEQAAACGAMGSPLYAALLEASAGDCRHGGPVWAVLRDHVLPGRGNAVALRFMAAVHRLVLERTAPALAVHYPSVGGRPGADVWEVFRRVVADHADPLRELVALPCQTNEVGRCAPLAWGFLLVAEATGLPLRCLEIGASAGLNLRWDRYRYAGPGTRWGPQDSPVDLQGLWADDPPAVPEWVEVVERAGCDPAPVDPTTPEGRLALSASVWADMTDRFGRLGGALQLAREVPAPVTAAQAHTWIPRMLADPVPGVATVVYHSVVAEYVPQPEWAQFADALADAGRRATDAAPLAWVRLEPVSALRRHALSVVTWPGGTTRDVATSGSHGQDVRAIAGDASAHLATRLEAQADQLRGRA